MIGEELERQNGHDGLGSPACGEDCLTCSPDCTACPGLHDQFPPGAAVGPEALAGAAVDFAPSGGSYLFTVSCVPALPDPPGSGTTSYSPALASGDSAAFLWLPFFFPFADTFWFGAYVGSNGSLTFGEADPYAPNSEATFYGFTRAAPLATDLDGGTVVVDEFALRLTFTWMGWSDAVTGAPVADFQLTLWSTGELRFAYESGALASSAIAGLSVGSGTIGTPVDLTPAAGCP